MSLLNGMGWMGWRVFGFDSGESLWGVFEWVYGERYIEACMYILSSSCTNSILALGQYQSLYHSPTPLLIFFFLVAPLSLACLSVWVGVIW
jgi:hypothetical protein